MAAYPEGGFFRGKNLVFDRRLRTAPPAAPIDDVIGTCQQCSAPSEDYGPQRRCAQCRLLLLLCPACCEVHRPEASSLFCDQCAGNATAPGAPAAPVVALPQRANRRRRGRQAEGNESGGLRDLGGRSDRSDRSNRNLNGEPRGALQEQRGIECCGVKPHRFYEDGLHADATVQYEYLDHTADIQLHSWGVTLAEAFEQQVVGMMALITELPAVRVDGDTARRVEVAAAGHDLHSLLYSFLDEWLYQFNGELFVSRRVKIRELDRETFRISSAGVGETFQLGRHPQGIEVKGITYSAMSITEAEGRVDILVIVDV